MKVLHTADWHIGKVLHKHHLQDEIRMFFDWLLATISEQDIDLLLVSGDIFDLANPSAKDRQLYYSFLRRLVDKNIHIVITGGNHDSVGFLNAPRELLDELNITIIGGATHPIEDEIVEIHNAKGSLEVVVAAVPFLRDKDLRNTESDKRYKSRTEAIVAGIKEHYTTLANICEEKYPNIPAIAMGHLYVVGVEASDSERDIHIGNTAAIDYKSFPTSFDYVALGHIHKPQLISSNQYIRYSGSPIALSFSEKEDDKRVIIFEIKDGKVGKPYAQLLPKFRELRKFTGDLQTVKRELQAYAPQHPLVSFVEIEVVENEFSSVILSDIEDVKASYADNATFKILKGKTSFNTGTKDTSDLFKSGENIEDLVPLDVFKKRLEIEEIEANRAMELIEAFQLLQEEVEQEEGL